MYTIFLIKIKQMFNTIKVYRVIQYLFIMNYNKLISIFYKFNIKLYQFNFS